MSFAGPFLGLVLVAVALCVALFNSFTLWNLRELVAHSHEVRALLVKVRLLLSEAESSERGFIITGDDEYLLLYREAVEKIPQCLDRFERTHILPPQDTDRLRSIVATRLSLLERGLEQRRSGGFEAGARVVFGGEGLALARSIAAFIDHADRREARLLAQRQDVAGRRWWAMVLSSLAGWGMGSMLVVWALRRAHREFHAAEAAERQFRQLFESAPGLYLVLEPNEFRIEAVSNSYLEATRTEREMLIGKRMFDAFPADRDESTFRNLKASLERVKATGRTDVMAVQRYPIRSPAAEGGGFEERWWSPLNSPILGPDGEVCYIVHRVEDVTSVVVPPDAQQLEAPAQHLLAEIVLRGQELQLANERLRSSEERLQAVNRELADFATIISHDLKAPLRAVSTLSRWLQQDHAQQLDEEGLEHLREMSRRVERMNRMIDQILEYSRLGRREGEPAAVRVADLVAEVVGDLGLPDTVRVIIAPDLPTVEADPIRLRQVFQNLIENAVKHSDNPRPEIRIDWSDKGACWQMSVCDNGPGIEERHFERIFRIFQTLPTPDESEEKGTGIGLAVVKRIVELAGGRVWVESRRNEGSTFCFTWPKSTVASYASGSATVADAPRSGEFAT